MADDAVAKALAHEKAKQIVRWRQATRCFAALVGLCGLVIPSVLGAGLMASTTPGMAAPDVVEAGRVMATLDDWRAILFVSLVLCGLMFFGLMTSVLMAFRAMLKSATAMSEMASGMQAMNATLSRLESQSGRVRE